MVDLDLKDRKILYELDLNCRQSNAQIGKKIGLSRKVVEYRIKRMEEEGVIRGYWTLINSFKLGYNSYRYFITYQNATQKIKNEMINFLIQYKNTFTVYSSSGPFDLGVLIWIRDLKEFNNFWEEFNDTFGDYIHEKIYSVFLYAYCYRQTFLLPDDYDISERKKFITMGPGQVIDIDKLDYDILNNIVLNARKPIVDLAEQLKCSSQAINYRIKTLIDKGVIQLFRVSIDYPKLGLQNFLLQIWLRQLSKRKEIWRYIENYPFMTYIQTYAGYSDLQMELVIKNIGELENFMQEISEKFPDSIRKYNFSTTKEQYFIRCLPDMKFK